MNRNFETMKQILYFLSLLSLKTSSWTYTSSEMLMISLTINKPWLYCHIEKKARQTIPITPGIIKWCMVSNDASAWE